MFILIPIVINSSLTSKRAHRCSPIVIAVSLVVSWDSSSFSFDCSAKISKRHREGKKIIASILLSMCKINFSLQEHYIANSNGETVWKWVPKVVSNFHNDPMIKESRIVGLLRHVWMYARKEKVQWDGHFFHHRYYFENFNGGYVQI